jgi:hypothetical protein
MWHLMSVEQPRIRQQLRQQRQVKKLKPFKQNILRDGPIEIQRARFKSADE